MAGSFMRNPESAGTIAVMCELYKLCGVEDWPYVQDECPDITEPRFLRYELGEDTRTCPGDAIPTTTAFYDDSSTATSPVILTTILLALALAWM